VQALRLVRPFLQFNTEVALLLDGVALTPTLDCQPTQCGPTSHNAVSGDPRDDLLSLWLWLHDYIRIPYLSVRQAALPGNAAA